MSFFKDSTEPELADEKNLCLTWDYDYKFEKQLDLQWITSTYSKESLIVRNL